MRSRRSLLPMVLLLASLAACAPEAATQQGREISNLYTFFLYVAAVVFVLVTGLIAWSIIRYRAKPGASELPPQTHTNLALEVTWFAIPTLLVIVLFVLSIGVSWRLGHDEAEPVRTVAVEGFQWGWRFDYGNGVRLTSLPQDPAEVVVPTDTPLRFELRSADVIHNFWIPRFVTKRDVVPGRVNLIDFTIEEEGTFRGVCAEFCGLLHDQMNFSVRAVSAEEFEGWLQEQEST